MAPTIAIAAWGICITQQQELLSSPLGLGVSSYFKIVPLTESKYDYFLSIEHFPEPLRAAESVVPVERRMLATFEPKTVNPLQYRPEIRNRYGQIFVASEFHKVQESDTVFWSGGLTSQDGIYQNINESWSKQDRTPGSIVFVNGNKFSFVLGSKYHLRRQVAKKFASAAIPFTIAGQGWKNRAVWEFKQQIYEMFRCLSARQRFQLKYSLPLPRRNAFLQILGEVDNSIQAMSSFEFAVVIENEASYITEKLFNAILAGCVVLYHGPDLERFGVPSDICIPCEGSSKDFLAKYKNVVTNVTELAKIREAGRSWILDDETSRNFGHAQGLARLASLVAQKVRNLSDA